MRKDELDFLSGRWIAESAMRLYSKHSSSDPEEVADDIMDAGFGTHVLYAGEDVDDDTVEEIVSMLGDIGAKNITVHIVEIPEDEDEDEDDAE